MPFMMEFLQNRMLLTDDYTQQCVQRNLNEQDSEKEREKCGCQLPFINVQNCTPFAMTESMSCSLDLDLSSLFSSQHTFIHSFIVLFSSSSSRSRKFYAFLLFGCSVVRSLANGMPLIIIFRQ